MKKLILLLCLTAMLTGCSSDAVSDVSDDGFVGIGKSSGSEEEQFTAETSAAETTTGEKASETKVSEEKTTVNQTIKEDAVEAPASEMSYRQILENIFYDRTLPDGNTLPDDGYDITANEFAVCDVDSDGRDELIFMYHNTAMAGKFARIFDHDSSGGIKVECGGFPSMRFYGSGVIEVNIAHNQGHSGAFWPYTLYQYDPGADKYNEIAFVEAMDKEIVDRINAMIEESGSDNLLEYPQEADTSGSGFVYYIRPKGYSGDVSPVDVTEYDAWHEQYISGAEQIELPFMKMTEENIQTIDQ